MLLCGLLMEKDATHHPTPVDDLILSVLETQGPRTIEDLAAALPTFGWSVVFLSIDRLSRAGRLLLRPAGQAGYRVSLKSSHATM